MKTTVVTQGLILIILIVSQIVLSCVQRNTQKPGSPEEPVRYIGEPITTHQHYHDGQLQPAVGVHNFQVFRANRSHPTDKNNKGYTYNHAPMLAYWNDAFYLEFLGSEWREHGQPTETFLTHSKDGITWSPPEVIFPAIEYEPGQFTIAHQRMGFYTAPNGRLLVLSFYGIPTGSSRSPNTGNGIGRAVREIYKDRELGKIYFIRSMPHAGYTEKNVNRWYPFYTTSQDKAFIESCDSLLANKLMTQQWWEEDRSKDGFFALSDSIAGFGCKALSFYHRKDGAVVGLWKQAWAALSYDEGRHWTRPVHIDSKPTGGAKEWGQRTDDGRFAIVYCPMPQHSQFRWPLAVITGDDGIMFDTMLCIHGEVPVTRFQGVYKDRGPQYVRGIVEGNGNPPGNEMWITYSMNKEDIWVSRVPVPLREKVDEPVNDNFENMSAGGFIKDWNVYSPIWAPVTVEQIDDNKCLALQDRDPYDYAKAVRVFPEYQKATLQFRIKPVQKEESHLEIEVLDRYGNRAICILFDSNQESIIAFDGPFTKQISVIDADIWYNFQVKLDAVKKTYDLNLNGKLCLSQAKFYWNQTSSSVERLEFRTGAYRRENTYEHSQEPSKDTGLPNADEPSSPVKFYIDDVIIKKN